ncbi:hypothetical protein GCK72_002883 [Caenorhabditis remanei]|uniref:Uncharacterized protein n=1 Tax=Caenorhabditis remanei TaxID=31234 RepID=A0A6A5HT03_CAERE|nr:hypothetical protein GCK72_002883 [Caenorhabditis remanei]KAF1771058.1 hypothetical protein GCK72_002883 [Caenorhabditis remanei]
MEARHRRRVLVSYNHLSSTIGHVDKRETIADLFTNTRGIVGLRQIYASNDEIDVGDIFEKEICEERATDEAVIALNVMSSHRMHNKPRKGRTHSSADSSRNALEKEQNGRRGRLPYTFSNFLQELLVAINSPEWAASEMILTALGSLLIKNFRSKSMDMTIRQAKLRKDMKDEIAGCRLNSVVKKAFYLMDDKGSL